MANPFFLNNLFSDIGRAGQTYINTRTNVADMVRQWQEREAQRKMEEMRLDLSKKQMEWQQGAPEREWQLYVKQREHELRNTPVGQYFKEKLGLGPDALSGTGVSPLTPYGDVDWAAPVTRPTGETRSAPGAMMPNPAFGQPQQGPELSLGQISGMFQGNPPPQMPEAPRWIQGPNTEEPVTATKPLSELVDWTGERAKNAVRKAVTDAFKTLQSVRTQAGRWDAPAVLAAEQTLYSTRVKAGDEYMPYTPGMYAAGLEGMKNVESAKVDVSKARVNQQGMKIMLDASEQWPYMPPEDRAAMVKQAMPFLPDEDAQAFSDMSLGLSFDQKRRLAAAVIEKGKLDLAVKKFNSDRQIALGRLAVAQKSAGTAAARLNKTTGGVKVNPISAMNTANALKQQADKIRLFLKSSDKNGKSVTELFSASELAQMQAEIESYDAQAESALDMARIAAGQQQGAPAGTTVVVPGFGAQGTQGGAKKPSKPNYSRATTGSSQNYLKRMAEKYKGKSAVWIGTNIVYKRHGHKDWDISVVEKTLKKYGAR